MKNFFSALLRILKKPFHAVHVAFHPIFLIFSHDVKTIFKNFATTCIILGLAFLPSLYAWINIYASWDPYANTGNLPVAIVSNDQGAVYNGKVVNVGTEIVKELKKNKSIGWAFVDEWQANYGLNEGKYYALIEIPNNFSSRLLTLTTSTPQKPAITYRVNQKLNSIATKITDAAKVKLAENVKENFVKTVTTEAISTVKAEMKDTHMTVPTIQEMKNTLLQANDTITSLKKYTASANTDAEGFRKYLNKSTTLIPKLDSQINNLQSMLDADKSLLLNTQTMANSMLDNLNTDAQQLSKLDSQNQQMIALLQQANGNSASADTITLMQHSATVCSTLDALLQSDIKTLHALQQSYDLQQLSLVADTLQYIDRIVLNERAALNAQIPILSADTSKKSSAAALKALSGLSSSISTQMTTLSSQINTDAKPVLNGIVSSLTLQAVDTGNLVQLTQTILPQLNALATFNTARGEMTSSQTKDLNNKLTSMQAGLNTLYNKVNSITDKDLAYASDLIENHPEEIADFISSPVTVKEVDYYHANTFGLGVAPFYTVLAIWIGALLACALLTVQYEPDEINGWKLNLTQKYFGKMLIFLCISLVQSIIITLGDIYVVGVHPADQKLMLEVSLLTSVTFTVIIFTLVALLGNVGKAAAVIMMVFQIAGAGGIYPIVTNPQIFGKLAPLWPFSYAIEYFREAISGPTWAHVYANEKAMVFFIIAYLLVSTLKKPFHIMNAKFESIYKKAKI